jgi:predicted Zn-dependent protease
MNSTHRSNRLRVIASAGSILILTSILVAADNRTVLKPGWNMFSPQQDVEVGQQVSPDAERQLPMLNNSRVDSYVNNLGRRLAAKAPGEKYMGTQILFDAGYDPRAMAQFFEKIETHQNGSGPVEFFSNHPSPDNRIERVNQEVNALGGGRRDTNANSREFADANRYLQSLAGPAAQSARRGPPTRKGSPAPTPPSTRRPSISWEWKTRFSASTAPTTGRPTDRAMP